VIRIQKRQLKEEEKNFRQALMQKADSGELSLTEKEKHEEFMQYIRQKEQRRNQAIIIFIGLLGVVLTVLFLRYGGQRLVDITMPQQKITYYEVPGLSNRSTTELLQKVAVHIERNNSASNLFNSAIGQYNEAYYVDHDYITHLASLKEFSADTSLADLDVLFKEIVDKQILVLKELMEGKRNIHNVNRTLQEIQQLNETYTQSIIYILQNEDIKCENTQDGISIYE
jgi:hypothetical protein